MNIIVGPGKHKKIEMRENIKKVRKWFESNPESTIKDCCDGTGLSHVTVRKHINSINSSHEK